MTEDITVVYYCFVAGDSSLRPSLSPVLSKSSVIVAVTSNSILTAPPTPVSTTPVTSLTPRTSPHPASHVPSSSSSHHGSYYLPHPRPLTPHNVTTHSPHPHHHPSHHIPSSGECPVKFVHVARLKGLFAPSESGSEIEKD